MNPLVLASAALGLVLIPPPDLARRRLDWLVRDRRGSDASDGPLSFSARHRFERWVIERRVLLGLPVALLVALSVGVVPGLLVLMVVLAARRCLRSMSRSRQRADEGDQLAHAVDALAEEYRSGATVSAAFRATEPAAGAYSADFRRAALGAADGSELAALLLAEDHEEQLLGLAVACRVASRVGSPLVSVLAGVSADLAADRYLRRAIGVAVTGPRSSAVLLALLPTVGLAMGQGMGAHPLRILLHTKLGLAALTVGVCLDLAGVLWTVALTQRAQP
jgi:tight adherence protein B